MAAIACCVLEQVLLLLPALRSFEPQVLARIRPPHRRHRLPPDEHGQDGRSGRPGCCRGHPLA
eukprot:13612211-Alexandrium_andersonii.AAC.1